MVLFDLSDVFLHVVWCSRLIQTALGGRCPHLALSTEKLPMPVRKI